MTKILVVDDDPTLVDFLKLLLESEGYETLEAYDGKMAAKMIEAQHPALVLLDYMMPNMDGLDVLKYVNTYHDSSFVIMLTGKGSEQVAVECMKAGAADYVVKPFDNEHLLGIIRSVLRVRESELQKRQLQAELQETNTRLQKYISDLEAQMKSWSERRVDGLAILDLAIQKAPPDLRELLEKIRTELGFTTKTQS